MQTKHQELFTTVRTEGSVLPADLLQRIVEESTEVGGLSPSDYHLSGERLNEAVSRSWNRLQGAWAAFRQASEKLPPGDAGTTAVRERWLLPLFQELGYGRLQGAKSVEVEGKTYPISHLWQHTPIHLVSFRADLDKRAAGVAGASRSSPHSLVQELLNREDRYLWGIVSNGFRLRILRDNKSLTRQAFVEFDLQAMMDGQVYPDFKLLWLLCHESRVEGERPEQCWLEKWSQTAIKQGTRALESLREGVERAIVALGRGFVAHPANRALRDRLRAGTLDKQDYYRQLLRMIYRLLFLFVAEDRGLLFDPASDAQARDRYTRFYSTQRLRTLAGKTRGTPHTDLYESLTLVFAKLDQTGCAELGLPALGSFLWSAEAIPQLKECRLSNRDLLDAVRELAYAMDGQARRPVDYKNLGAEELGGIYESLLELHPQINTDAATFELVTAGGHERKTTGSYYTPTSLVNCLLDAALEPVLDNAVKGDEENKDRGVTVVERILSLKVCDPACGSGHFLIAAAHRIAKRLAGVRSGDEEPPPEVYRHALRDAIGHCIYGVDLNPMAVELCKVSLWMEALEPGRPLSFLDHRIQMGNALIGVTPALLADGIPDEAFDPVEGDEKPVCKEFKKQNKDERKGQMHLFHEAKPWEQLGNFAASVARLDAVDDDTLEGVRLKQRSYEELVKSSTYETGRLLADAWCAAFMWKKTKTFDYLITDSVFRRIAKNPHDIAPWMRDEIWRLARHYGFFHWQLAFPDVFRWPAAGEEPDNPEAGWSGGFSLMLGNPPWDALSPDAKEFFSVYDPQVRVQNKEGQERIINALLMDSTVRSRWDEYCRDLYVTVHFLKSSGRFRLYAPGNLGKGDFNVFRMFVETCLVLTAAGSWAAQIVPEGMYNGANSMAIRQELFDHFRLRWLLGFENTREVWFRGVHSAAKFCLYAARKGGSTESIDAAFNLCSEAELAAALAGGMVKIPLAMIREFSPDALAVAELTSQLEIGIASKMYSRSPKFGDPSAGPPMRDYMREIDMGNDRDLFNEGPDGLPLYEGRMVWHYDHRAKGYRSGRGRSAVWEELPFGRADKSIQPQWYVPVSNVPEKTKSRCNRYRVGFCDVGSPTNMRTLVAALIPPNSLCGHSLPTIDFGEENLWFGVAWTGVANSYCADFIIRPKVSLHVTFTILDSLPAPRFGRDDGVVRGLIPRILLLTCTGVEMTPLWQKMQSEGWVPPVPSGIGQSGVTNEEQRNRLQAEIEAIVARHVYALTREELGYILDTFPIVKRLDVERYGRFRTKDLVLEAYEAMAELRPVDWVSVFSQPSVGELGPVSAPTVVTAVRETDPDLIVRAFLDTRQGMSSDYVVASPEANAEFLARVRKLGVRGCDFDINHWLLNARKAGKLKGEPTETEYRLPTAYEPWVFASEWAGRHLQRQLVGEIGRLVTLDDILCNPSYAARFDEIAARVKPGFKPLEYRWAAFSFRKRGKSKPAAKDLKVPLERQMTLDEVLGGAPHGPGLYLIRSGDNPLYVNHATDLRAQIDHHTEIANGQLVPEWLSKGIGPADRLSYAYLEGIGGDRLREARISSIAKFRPWLNLLDLEGAA